MHTNINYQTSYCVIKFLYIYVSNVNILNYYLIIKLAYLNMLLNDAKIKMFRPHTIAIVKKVKFLNKNVTCLYVIP